MSSRTQPRHHRSSAGRRHPLVVRRIALGTAGALIAGVGMLAGATSAAAAVPTFPDNLLVFPNRDFVSIEGYSEYAGQTATLEVSRAGVGVVGSATAKVSGADVAFEVNHPGGVCWGNGTNLQVTPDIVAGDVVSISIGGNRLGETTVQDAFVDGPAVVNGNTLTVKGTIAPGVNQANTEQRIIAPDLRTTAINRRDIRALPGPMTPAPRGGYSSGMSFDNTNHTFTATYVFDDPAWATIARDSALGPRMMSWEVVDFAGNRQGVTIGEFGEPGGPGIGGCPNGPTSSGPAAPTNVRAVNVPNGVKLTWTPAVAVAGTPAITGYRVTAVSDTAVNGETNTVGKRIASPTANGTTLTGLSGLGAYTLEVQSVSRPELQTFPPVYVTPEADVTPPVITASPKGGSYTTAQTVSLNSNEAGSDIYYTLGDTSNGGAVNPVEGDIVSPTASHYTGPITVAGDTIINFAGFDAANNVSIPVTETYVITNKPVPAVPTITTVTPGVSSATVSWTPGDATTVTGYAVKVYDVNGAPVGATRVPSPATATSMLVDGLQPDVAYSFTVTATNDNGSSLESTKSAPVTTQGPVTANAGPDQTVTRTTAPQKITLTGNGSTNATGTTYQWTQLTSGTGTLIAPNDPDKVSIDNSTTLAPSFTLALFKYPMTNKPLTFRLTVTAPNGTRFDDVLVTPKADSVQFATAKWKLGDFRVTGGGSTVGGTVTIHQGSLSGPVLGSGPLVAAVAPATGSTFDIRVRTTAAPLNANPGQIWIESTLGGTAGPFTTSG